MSSIDVVKHFLHTWESPGAWRDALRDYLSADCVYEVVGLTKSVGPEHIIAFIEHFNEKLPFSHMSVTMLNIVERTNIVMTERVDHFHNFSGTVFSSIPTMGIFEVSNEWISAWRDYCDMSEFKT
jgi:limonene-1,2-epoxide hydrolase